MAYYDDPYIYHIPARECVEYWNEPYSWNTMREMPKPPMPPPKPQPPKPQPPMPPMPEPPPVVCPQPDKDYYTWPANLEKALRLIEEAVMGEAGDEKFYEAMMKLCDKEDKGIFEGIIADERKHAQLFRTIYCELTGQILPKAHNDKVKLPKTCCEGLQEAIFEELAAADRYRRVLYAMQNRRHINMLVEIITDEQKHAQKLNYLFSKNDCGEKCKPKK
jgi:rubrerythrin